MAAINPMQLVTIRISAGTGPTQPNGVRVPRYETPGALVGSIAAGVLNATTISAGVLMPAQTIAGVGIAAGTMITSQLSGALGGSGSYQLSQIYDAGAVAMTTSLQMLGQVQPMTKTDLMQMEGLNMAGDKKAIYLNGAVDSVIRVTLKGGDLITTPDGLVWLVVLNAEGFTPTAGWVKALMTLQAGS